MGFVRGQIHFKLLLATTALVFPTFSVIAPAAASSFSVGGGTITTTQTDTSADYTPSAGPFLLKPNTTGSGDTITVSNVTINNTSGSPNQFALDFGYTNRTSGSYSIFLNGSSLTTHNGSGVFWAYSDAGTVTLDTTGGAANTVSGGAGYTLGGSSFGATNIVVRLGPDVVATTGTAIQLLPTIGGGNVSLDMAGTTLSATGPFGDYGIYVAPTSGSSVTLGALNNGLQGSISVDQGYGINVGGSPNTYIRLGNAGTITAKGGIFVGNSDQAIVDSYGTIIAGSLPAITGNYNETVTLETGSKTVGKIQGGQNAGSVNVFNIYSGADISGATFEGKSGGTNTIHLEGTSVATFDVGIATNINTIQKDDTGGWTLANSGGASTTSFIVNNGLLTLGASGVLSSTNAVTIAGGTFDLNGTHQTIGALSGTGGAIALGNGALTTNSAANTSLSTAIGGTGSFTKGGTGTLILTGTNTYTGSTTISAGTLQIGNGGTSGSIVGNVVDNGTLVFDRSDTYQFAPSISGTGAVKQVGGGTLELSNGFAYSYTGGTEVSGGSTLQLDNSVNPGSGAISLSGGTLRSVNDFFLTNTITFRPGASNTLLASTGTPLILAGAMNFNGTASDTVTFGSATDTGTLILEPSAVNLSASPSALVIAGGAVEIANGFDSVDYALGRMSSVTIESGATLVDFSDGNGRNAPTPTLMRLFGGGQLVLGSAYPVVALGTSNFAGRISGTGYVQIGSFLSGQPAATVILTGDNNSPTEFQIAPRSTLQIGNGGTTGSISNSTTVVGYSGSLYGGNAVLEFDRSDNLTYGGYLSGSLVLEQAGSGVLTISSNNSPSGPADFYGSVVVASGGLSISSDNNLNGNPIALSNATTLYTTATGTFTSPVTVVGDPTFNVASGTTTIWSGQISDGSAVGDVEVTGGGGLILTNTSNSYSGGTVVKGWSDLVVTDDHQLGGTSGGLTLGDATTSGTLQLNAAFSLSASRPITLAAGGGYINTIGNNATISQAITGLGSLGKVGAGTLTLSGNNTYTGVTTIFGGTLQIGNGGTSGSILGDITNNGFVLFNRSDVYTYAGAISGTGGMTQTGSGTLILTGNSTYSGNTTVSAGVNSPGTLQIGAGGTSGSVASKIVDNGYLLFDRSDTYTYANVISGIGSVAQIGTGTLILSGANTYTGGTAIASQATLQLGNGGTTGSILGNVLDNGVLVFDRSDTYTFAGDISGTGTLSLIGTGRVIFAGHNTLTGGLGIGSGATVHMADLGDYSGGIIDNGTLDFNGSGSQTFASAISGSGNFTLTGGGMVILTGENSYTGGTTITSGTLQIGAGGTSGSVHGPITNNGTVVFDRSDSYNFSDVISGIGSLHQDGTGALVLSGMNTYTGNTYVDAGTLSISSDANLGNGGTVTLAPGTTLASTATGTFTHAVTVAGDPTFNVASGTTTTWSGLISDGASAGTVEVSGGGTFAPTNTSNGYSGGTVVKGSSTLLIGADGEIGATSGALTLGDATTSGTLQLGASFNLASTRAFALGTGGGTIDTNGFSTTISQAITGPGGLTKAGVGVLALAGTNSYSGGTFVFGGALQIGAGGTSGSILGDVTNNGLVLFNRSDIYTYAGVISGSGGMTQTGTGTLILTGNSAYLGNTTVSAGVSSPGTLQIGAGGTSGSVVSMIINNGYLLFDRSDAYAFSNVISGIGSVSQIGTGTLTLSGRNTYSGTTTVNAGTLSVNGSIASSAVTVHSGATLSGTGTVGVTTVTNGGTLAPGNSGIGTLHVNGNLVLASGAIYAVDSTPASSDLVSATGAASLAGTLAVTPTGSYSYNQAIAVVTASGGLTGTFTNLNVVGSFGANITPVLEYSGNGLAIALEPTAFSPLLPHGAPANEVNVAAAIDMAVQNDGARPTFAPLAGLSSKDFDGVLSQLSGELPNGAINGGIMIQGSFLDALVDPYCDGRGSVARTGSLALGSAGAPVRVAFNGPVDQMPLPRSSGSVTVWGSSYGGWSNVNGDSLGLGTHNTNTSDGGLALGVDYRSASGDTVIGAALGTGQLWWDIVTGLGTGRSDVEQAGLYGSKSFGRFYLSGAVEFAEFKVKTNRMVHFEGDNLYGAKFDMQSEGFLLEAGRSFLTDSGFGITPYIDVRAMDFRSPNYAESTLAGSSLFALAYAKKAQSDLTHELGVQLDDMLTQQRVGQIVLSARVAWRHDYCGDVTELADFEALPYTTFTVYGAARARDAARISIGAQASIADGVLLALKAQGDLSDPSQAYSGNAVVAYRW